MKRNNIIIKEQGTNHPMKRRKVINCLNIFLLALTMSSCKKFISVDPPKAQLIKETIFRSDGPAIASMSDVYYQISVGNTFSGGLQSVNMLCGMASDELVSHNSFADFVQFYANNVRVESPYVLSIWGNYNLIYRVNAIIEGLEKSEGVTAALKAQLKGEALFIRAFVHFYLVDMFGDVPYITTTDYRLNSVVSRTPKVKVYQNIISDLEEASSLLVGNYVSTERVRPNKWAANAFLARVYLFAGDWVKAEAQATTILANVSMYGLTTLDSVFKKNSMEAIWQIMPGNNQKYTNEGNVFILTSTPSNAALNSQLVNSFEAGDERSTKWVNSITNSSGTFYYPSKYKDRSDATNLNEYAMVLRLAEQYLIRAEARAQQDNVLGAQADINAIRNRALLGNTTANNKASLLSAIEQERKIELFTEWGHRWFDLKRTNRADAVLGLAKAPNWQPTDVLFPIPQSEIDKNANLKQNAGY